MSREGKGNPGRIVLKNRQPKLRLADVLRRRRTNLSAFVAELGITTYTSLCVWCKRMGVSPPESKEFEVIFPPEIHINSPQEGVIVLEAPDVINEITGRVIDPEAPAFPIVEVVTTPTVVEPTDDSSKKPRKKKVLPTA